MSLDGKNSKSALHAAMDIISRRELSEVELTEKLKQKQYSDDEIAEAVQKAKEKKWLSSSDTLSKKWAQKLHLKNKGIEFINDYLNEKGLPPVRRDENLELEKALSLVKTKMNQQNKIKAARLLASRGFDSDTIENALEKVFHDEEF